MEELANEWLSLIAAKQPTNAIDDAIREDAERALDFVLLVLAKKPSDQVIANLAAGPLEDLLTRHGPAIIARIEVEARRTPDFRHLLGGVWQNATPDEVWQRVLKAAPERW